MADKELGGATGKAMEALRNGKSEADAKKLIKDTGYSDSEAEKALLIAKLSESVKNKGEPPVWKRVLMKTARKRVALIALPAIAVVVGLLLWQHLAAINNIGPAPASLIDAGPYVPPPLPEYNLPCKNSEYLAVEKSPEPMALSGENRTSLTMEGMEKLLMKLQSDGSGAFEGIRDMTCLNELRFYGRLSVFDLAPLSNMQNIRYLSFDDTNISDFSGLQGMASLKELEITDQDIDSLAPLGTLANLERLVLSNTNTQDLSALSSLGSLKVLDLRTTGVFDISPLAGLNKLEFLDLSNNNVTDLSPLRGKGSLKTVLLLGNYLPPIVCDELKETLSNATVTC